MDGVEVLKVSAIMKRWQSEQEARNDIRELVADYYEQFKKNSKEFEPGDRINYSGRVYDAEEMISLTDSVLDFWLTSGRFCEQFEKNFSELLNVKYTHIVNSGSSANLLAFMVLTAPELGDKRINRGDEVITVACGFPTTIAPIMQYGAVPVFVDVTIPEYNIDVSMLEEALSDRTKAVMVAHTLGNPFNLKEVKRFCEQHQLWLVEDNCDALGSKYTIDGDTKYTGTWGDIGTSSFYPPHHITMGEGGAVYTDNPLLHRLILSYRDWGRDCVCPSGYDGVCGHRFDRQLGELPIGYDHKYIYSHLGYNLKATDMQASIGVEQLKKLSYFTQQRISNWDYLKELMLEKNIEKYAILPVKSENSIPSWFGFTITIKRNSHVNRAEIIKYLESHNIQTRLLFSGNLLKHPCFDEYRDTKAYRVVGNLNNTNYIMDNTFWIGVYPGMTNEMLDYMVDCLFEAFNYK